jgi:cyclic beta-1,2-glucan synthetase
VSSVDSGNLAGHLIALANTCRDWANIPFDLSRRLAGIADSIDLTREEAVGRRDGHRTQTVTWTQFDEALAGIIFSVRRGSIEQEIAGQRMAGLAVQADTMADIVRALITERGDGTGIDRL